MTNECVLSKDRGLLTQGAWAKGYKGAAESEDMTHNKMHVREGKGVLDNG